MFMVQVCLSTKWDLIFVAQCETMHFYYFVFRGISDVHA